MREVEYGDASAAPSIVVWPHVPGETGADARNRAAARAESRYVAFLAAGVRPEPGWVRNAVDILEGDIALAGVGSRVLDAEGRPAGTGSAMLAFFGQPYEWPPALLHGRPDEARDVLFPSAAAMVLRRGPFLEVGGFDERFVGVLDEVDLGWRLWLAGYRVRYEPALTVVLQPAAADGHRSGDTAAHDSEEIHRLRNRNALATIYKNYSEQTLGRCLPAAMALAVRCDRQRGAAAVEGFVDLLPALAEARRRVQAGRVRSDQEVLRLFGQPPDSPEVAGSDTKCGEDLRALNDAFALTEVFGRRRKIVIVTADTLGPRMAGPAIRAWHIAVALSDEHDVELVTTGGCSVEHPRFRCRAVTARALRELESWCDILLFQGWVMASCPWLKESSKILVVDIYDPFHLEGLEQAKDLGEDRRLAVFRNSVATLNDQLLRGDLLLCASAKQRDFWLGQLSALGRLNPVTYDEDETMSSLLAVVPFGLSPIAPVHSKNVIKGVLHGIGPEDKVILWGGGIYNWFDPLTLIRAVDQVRHERLDVRLFFLGVQHPNPEVPEMRMAQAARALADSLGLLDRHVFFNEGWVPYEERANYLLEADIGVSTHLDHVETAFSFRTRMLDYLWAGLPIVATRGDTFSELVEHEGIGLTVPAEDVDCLADALLRLLDDEGFAASCRKNAAAVAPRFTWARTLQPLIEFCRWPRRAPDLLRPELVGLGPALQPVTPVPPAPLGLRGDLALIRTYLRDGGVPLLAEKVYSRARRVGRRMVRADSGRTAGPHAGTF